MGRTGEKDRPVVSVIVPCFNAEPYLDDCISSVLAQTLTPFELILIDDCSSDGSRLICEIACEKDKRVRLLSLDQRGGVSHARNLGISLAEGKYIYFLDADDMIHPQVLEQLFFQAEKEKTDMTVTGFIISEIIGLEDWKEMCNRALAAEWTTFSGEELLSRWFGMDCRNVVWGKLFLKVSIGTLRFEEGLQLAEDTLFNYQFLTAKSCKVSCTDFFGHYFRIRKDSSNHTQSLPSFLSSLKVKRFISNKELSLGRRENAVIMEQEYVRQIRNWPLFRAEKEKEETKKVKKIAREEKQNPLFKEISSFEKLLLFLSMNLLPLYQFFRRMRIRYLRRTVRY